MSFRKQMAVVEANPFALSSFVSKAMEKRVGESMKTQAMKEGHRPRMPISKQGTPYNRLPETATVVDCVIGIMRQRSEWTFSELKAETGLHHNKLQYSLDVLRDTGRAVRIEARGQRHKYVVTA